MKKNIISEHRNFGKALIALAKGLPAPEVNNVITEESIINTAKHEYCKSPEDLKKSRTTAKLIALTEQKAGDVLNIEKPNSTVVNIYSRFVSDMPITQKEKDYLLGFFHDEKSFKIAQDVFSKVNLLQGDNNNGFIQAYFKNNSEEKLNIKLFVVNLIEEIEKYKLIIPECEDLKELENGNDLVPEARYFEYKVNSKTQICAVSDWKIYFLDIDFESIKILDNGMIFGVSENEGKYLLSGQRKTGHLYTFHNMKGLIEIYEMLGLVNIEFISSLSSELENVLKTQNENGKKGLLEISEQERHKLPWNIKEFMMNENDILINDKFITAVNGEENEGKKINKYETFIKQSDGLELIANSYSEYGFEIKDRGDNLVSISTSEGMSLLRFNKEESKLEPIDSALTMAKYFDIANLLNGKPTVITRENGNNGVYIFNKETGKLDILMFGAKSYRIEGDIIKSKVGNKHIIHFWKDGVLYKLKKGYKYHYNDDGISHIKKGLIGNSFHANDIFEEMKEFLDPVDASELPLRLQ